MKNIEDAEFLLLRKAKELKKRMGDSEEIEELIAMAEGIIRQNFHGAFNYLLTAVEVADMQEEVERLINTLKKKNH